MSSKPRPPRINFTIGGAIFLVVAVTWSIFAPRVSPLASAAEAVRTGRTDRIELDDDSIGDDDLALLGELSGLK
jgi:hypothetical protein